MSYKVITPKIVATNAATTTLTAGQSDSVQVLNVATGFVTTLPAATALIAGTTYKFIVKTSVISSNYTIQGASSSDLFYGSVNLFSTGVSPYAINCPANGSSHYKLVMAGTTTGGLVGTVVTVTCLGLNAWLIEGSLAGSGTITATGVFA